MLVGDVSGHGSEASALSAELHDIRRRNVNYIDQSRVVHSLDEQFEQASAVDVLQQRLLLRILHRPVILWSVQLVICRH